MRGNKSTLRHIRCPVAAGPRIRGHSIVGNRLVATGSKLRVLHRPSCPDRRRNTGFAVAIFRVLRYWATLPRPLPSL
jgi:hypothetical protein